MRRQALDVSRLGPGGNQLLGDDHPLARAIDLHRGTKGQCAVLAAVVVGSVRPAAEGRMWALALIASAGVTLAAYLLVLAGRHHTIRDHATELIAGGRENVAIEAVQIQRRRLLRRRTRLTLARCLEGMVEQASNPRARQLSPAPPLFDYSVIRNVGDELRVIAELLRRGRSGAPGVARVERLVTRAGSPLYGHEAPGLRLELSRARRLLVEAMLAEDPGPEDDRVGRLRSRRPQLQPSTTRH